MPWRIKESCFLIIAILVSMTLLSNNRKVASTPDMIYDLYYLYCQLYSFYLVDVFFII